MEQSQVLSCNSICYPKLIDHSPMVLSWNSTESTVRFYLISSQEPNFYQLDNEEFSFFTYPYDFVFLPNRVMALSMVAVRSGQGLPSFYLIDYDSGVYITVDANPADFKVIRTYFIALGNDLLYVTQEGSSSPRFVVVRQSYDVPFTILSLHGLGWSLPVGLLLLNTVITAYMYRQRLRSRNTDASLYPKGQ